MTSIKDFMFGDHILPENRLARHRDLRIGVHHQAHVVPPKPSSDEAITLHVTTSGEDSYAEVLCFYRTGDHDPAHGDSQRLSLHHTQTIWDEVDWHYIHHWEGVLPPQNHDMIIRYQIAARLRNSKDWIYADNQAAAAIDGTHFAVWVDDSEQPAWVRDALIYHIFIDRFYPGDGADWQQPDDLSGIFGGTLRGVIQKLDYIQSLGFNTIWLSPFFSSPSHHGYNATDLYTVEPRLGTNQDLYELIDKIHARGMHIILDFVANHWSNFHPTFLEAQKDAQSEYYDWYHWISWPDEYQGFFDTKSLPQLNLTLGSPARQMLLDAAQYWLEKGFDGYRLDYAYGPPLDFWTDFRRACRNTNPNSWLFGEVIHAASFQRNYEGVFDGMIDFLLADALRQTFGYQTWDIARFDAFLLGHEHYFQGCFERLTILDNHDMNRFLFIADDDPARLKIAALVLYTLAGIPINYCGTETGVTQERPIHVDGRGYFEEARLPINWNLDDDHDLLAYFQGLVNLRKKYPWLKNGSRQTLHLDVDAGTYAYLRSGAGQQILIAINLSHLPQKITIPWHAPVDLHDHLSGNVVTLKFDSLIVELEPKSGSFLTR
ncbi:MAG: alpha-amylase family glycosyl hydrolase [Chloroflexota bacterium]